MSAAGIAAVNTVVATDTDLVAAVRDGDDVAFEELYRRYYPRIAAFVRGYLRDGGRAEDVTQEAFMSALRRLRQTDSEITFKPWIFEIARNAAIDQYRRNVRTDEVSIDIEGGFAPSEVSRVVRPRGPDSSVLDKQRLDHLRGALDELSDTHHRIIVMRELEGLSYREIGERMELTPAAVESTLFRARRKLEHEYAQLDTGRRCQLIGAVIGRLAEGMESDRDRRRLDRHARRCSSCRRRSRQLGVEPMLPRISIAARAAALLPLPAFAAPPLRRRGGAGGAAQHAAAPIGAVGRPRSRPAPPWRARPWPWSPRWRWSAAVGPRSAGAGPLDLGGNGRTVLEQAAGREAGGPESASHRWKRRSPARRVPSRQGAARAGHRRARPARAGRRRSRLSRRGRSPSRRPRAASRASRPDCSPVPPATRPPRPSPRRSRSPRRASRGSRSRASRPGLVSAAA